MDRRFRVLVGAHAVSCYGNYLNLIALSLFSYAVTGSAFGIGVVMALRRLSGFLAGMASGALLARAGRRTVMVYADAAQAVAMTALALCASRTPLWLLTAAVLVLGSGNTFFSVALRSAVPVMVGQQARSHANGLLVTARSVATVLGFASAAPVIGYGGYAAAFALNAASFVVSAAALLILRPRTDVDDAKSTESGGSGGGKEKGGRVPGGAAGSWFRNAVLGVPALVVGMILLRGTDALASASHNVALPVLAHAIDPAGPAVFMARFWAAWAAGTLLAHLVLKRRKSETAWGERAFAVGTCAMSLSFVLAFTGLPAAALVLAAVSAGFADGWTEIVYTSRLQAAPERQRSRLFALSAMAEQCGFALGTITAAAALEALPAVAVVGSFHGAAASGALVLLVCVAVRRGRPRPSASVKGTEGDDTHGTHTREGALPGA